MCVCVCVCVCVRVCVRACVRACVCVISVLFIVYKFKELKKMFYIISQSMFIWIDVFYMHLFFI